MTALDTSAWPVISEWLWAVLWLCILSGIAFALIAAATSAWGRFQSWLDDEADDVDGYDWPNDCPGIDVLGDGGRRLD